MSADDIAKARAIVREWYWQPDSWRRTSFVRFYESAPMASDVFKLVLDYLKTEETTQITVAGKLIELGETWNATDAWYQTMPAEKWNGTESTKIRVYQAFRASSDTTGGPYTVENGCQYKATHEFYWDVAEVPSVPASSSGVMYTLQGVTRDKDTGLFSCVLEKRTRVQQDVPEYRSGGTVFETVSEEQHLGVKAGVSAGKSASAGNGVIVQRRVTKNADCTSDVVNTTTTEVPQKNAIVATERILRGTRTTVTDRNQAAALPTSGLVVGERRVSRLTDGGRYDNETSKVAAAAAGDIYEACEKTIFEHSHQKTVNQQSKPGNPEASEAGGGKTYQKSTRATDEGTYDVDERTRTEKPVKDSVVVYRKTLRGTVETRTDRNQADALGDADMQIGETRRSEKTPGGLHDNTVERMTDKPAGEIGESCERQTSVHTHSTTENVQEKPEPVERDAQPGRIQRRQAQLTEQGTWDVVDTTVDYAERTASASGGALLAPTQIVVRNDARSAAPQNAPDVNRSVSVDVSPTERGTFNVREAVTTHVPSGAQVSVGSSAARVSLIVSRNDVSPDVSSEPGRNRSVDASIQPNEHGSYDKTIRVTSFSPVTSQATSNWATETMRIVVTRHDTNLNPSAEMGEASSEPDDNGAASTRVVEYSPIAVDSGWITWTSTNRTSNGTYTFNHGIRIFKNLRAVPSPSSGSNCNVSAAINKFGLYDGSLSYSDLVDWNESGRGGGVYGGIQTGTKTFVQYKHDALGKSWKRLVTVSVISFYGSGNEGTEANYKAGGYAVSGLSLAPRTYATGAPYEGPWQEAD